MAVFRTTVRPNYEPLESRQLLTTAAVFSTAVPSEITQLAAADDVYFVVANENAQELWRLDGSDDVDAQRVASFAADANVDQLTASGEFVYFTIDDSQLGTELWRSDGTENGTRLVRDIRPGPLGSQPTHLTDLGGVLFFSAEDELHGREVWRSLGNEADTSLVLDVVEGPSSSEFEEFIALPDVLYVQDASGGLYRTSDDESLVRVLGNGDGERLSDLTQVGDAVFAAREDEMVLLIRNSIRGVVPGRDIGNLALVGESLYFSQASFRDGVSDEVYWLPNPAARIPIVGAFFADGKIRESVGLTTESGNGYVYVSQPATENGESQPYSLWINRSSQLESPVVSDLLFSSESEISDLVVVDGILFFRVGSELYFSDGREVAPAIDGSMEIASVGIVQLDDAVLAAVTNVDGTASLWSIDLAEPEIGFSATSYTVTEDDVLQVKLTRSSTHSRTAVDVLFANMTATGGSWIESGVDFVNEAAEVVFEVGEAEKLVELVVVPDDLHEPNETFELSLRSFGSVVSKAAVVIVDDDMPPGFSVLESNGRTAMQIGESDSVDVVLHSEPATDVVINATTDDGRQISLTFSPAIWDLPQTIVFPSGVVAGSTTVTFSVDEAASEPAFVGLPTQSIEWVVSPRRFAIQPTDNTTIVQAGLADTVELVLNSQPTRDVVLQIGANADFVSLSSSAVTFTRETWDVPQTITLDAAERTGTTTLVIRVDESVSDPVFHGLGDTTLEVITLPPRLPEPVLLSDVKAPEYTVEVDGKVFFASGNELWVYDSIDPAGSTARLVRRFVEWDDSVYHLGKARLGTSEEHLVFVVGNRYLPTVAEVWSSDGTTNGTEMIGHTNLSEERHQTEIFRELTSLGLGINFESGDPSAVRFAQSILDGGYEGLLSDDIGSYLSRSPWIDLNGNTYAVSATELLRVERTGVTPIRSLDSEIVYRTDFNRIASTNIVVHAGQMLFGMRSDDYFRLWASDGTAQGTRLIREFDSAPHSTSLVQLGDRVYFTAGGVLGVELWSTDGTVQGTQLLKDIAFGSLGSEPMELTVVNDTLFFTADDGEHGRELWKTDGSRAGTILVRDIDENGNGIRVADEVTACETFVHVSVAEWLCSFGTSDSQLTASNGTLYFRADDGSGLELWKSNGTEQGTVAVTEGEHTLGALTAIQGSVLYQRGADDGAATDGAVTFVLSNGTRAGTEVLLSTDSNASDVQLVAAGGTLFEIRSATDPVTQPTGPLEPVGPGELLPGDVDGDDVVGFADFLVVFAAFGRSTDLGIAGADFDEDGVVGFADFLIISANFGRRRLSS